MDDRKETKEEEKRGEKKEKGEKRKKGEKSEKGVRENGEKKREERHWRIELETIEREWIFQNLIELKSNLLLIW